MKEFLQNTLPYLGIGDYVLFSITILIILISLYSIFEEGNPTGLLVPALISIGIALYINHIPYGVYEAKVIKVDDKVIGDNTPASKPFTLNIDKKYIRVGTENAIPLCIEKSNFYVTAYCSKYSYITITKMGIVKEKLLGWEPSDISREIEVNY